MIIATIDKHRNEVKIALAGSLADVFEEILVEVNSIFKNLPDEVKGDFASHLQKGIKHIVEEQAGDTRHETPKTNKDYVLSRIEKLDEKPILSKDDISYICSFIHGGACDDGILRKNTVCEACVRAWLKAKYREV